MEKKVILESIEFETIEITNKNSLLPTHQLSGLVNVTGIVCNADMVVIKIVKIKATQEQATREWAENILLNSI